MSELPRYFRRWDTCPECGYPIEVQVDRKTGQYLITTPVVCSDQIECEESALRGAGFAKN